MLSDNDKQLLAYAFVDWLPGPASIDRACSHTWE